MIDKRSLLSGGLAAATACAVASRPARLMAQGLAFAQRPPLVPILARPDRIFRITVCTRPFRATGPRVEIEIVGDKRIVHHYGHGGSGWSLSWGSAQEAVPMALQGGATEVAVVGAGAIGLTSAITAQRMGAKVTIYAKERFPFIRSARATGGWTPNSRIAMEGETGPGFADRWETMARASFAMHQSFLGLAGNPVEWTDRYMLSNRAPAGPAEAPPDSTAQPADTTAEPTPPDPNAPNAGRRFVELESRIADLRPPPELLPAGTHPFPTPFVRRTMSLTYNIADLCRQLETDFLVAGGRFVPAEFHEPADFARIREPVIINCTGYGAKALFNDASLTPVRGQIAWLIPQEGVNYGLYYKEKGLSLLGRRDGIVVQPLGQDDFYGFNDPSEEPDKAQARTDVELAATLFRGPVKPPD